MKIWFFRNLKHALDLLRYPIYCLLIDFWFSENDKKFLIISFFLEKIKVTFFATFLNFLFKIDQY